MSPIAKATIAKSIILLAVAAFLLPIMASALDGVEYKPGEKAAEDLFNKGFGKPWVGGEPFKSTYWSSPEKTFIFKPYPSYDIIGYLSAASSLTIASDSGKSLQLVPGPGSYPVYGYYSGRRLLGVFIDLSTSAGGVQMFPSL